MEEVGGMTTMKFCPYNGDICKSEGCMLWDKHAKCCSHLSTALTLRQLLLTTKKQTTYFLWRYMTEVDDGEYNE